MFFPVTDWPLLDKKVCLHKSNQQLFIQVSKKAIRVRNPPETWIWQVAHKAYRPHERILNYAMVSTQLHSGTKIRRVGFKWVLRIRRNDDRSCLVSLSYMEQTASIFLQLSVALFLLFFHVWLHRCVYLIFEVFFFCFIAIFYLTRGENGDI